MPACAAWIVQVPTATRVTVLPLSVQTGAVIDAKVTARPYDAVALTVNGAASRVLLAIAAKVIFWFA